LRIDLANKNPDCWDQSIALSQDDASRVLPELNLVGVLKGTFQVFPQGDDDYLIRGSVQGAQQLTCVRTLESFTRPFQIEVVLDVKKTSGISVQEIDDDDGDTFTVRIPALQEVVDITECVRQLVILQEPMNPVKDPDGDFRWSDKDDESSTPATDPRWDKLKALKAKFGNPNGQELA